MSKPRREGPSGPLRRLRDVVAQIERDGHPAWEDSFRRTQAAIADRIGFTASYLSALLGRGEKRNTDIGAELLGQFARGVGVDIRYFYLEYRGELPFAKWLLGTRSQSGAAAPGGDVSDLWQQLREELRTQVAEQAARHAREMSALAELARSHAEELAKAARKT